MQTQSSRSLQFDAILDAPFGAVGVATHGSQMSIELLSDTHQAQTPQNQAAAKVAEQISAYFADADKEIRLSQTPQGTPYQHRVWQAISAIPRGQVRTYGQLARQLGSGPRAVANACGANPLPLVIPCHRVVAQNDIGGFMQGDPNGLKIKRWLLRHEGVTI